MEQIAVFEEKVVLNPVDFHDNIQNFDGLLLKKLKTQLEGRCSKHGFVIPDSLVILSRSLGYAEKGRFTSDFLYYIKAQGRVLNPPEGMQVEGEVLRKNKMGMYVILNDAIRIMIPRDLHIGNVEFDEIEVGERIRIEIKKSRYQVNDSHILSIGQFLGRVSEKSSAAAAAATALPIVAAEEEIVLEEEEEEEEENEDAAVVSDEEEEEEEGEEEE
jgi:DNA-directed RNA polymerase subunit E'/Rpb7